MIAGIDSLKKDINIRQTIQLEMLADKFNKGETNKKAITDNLLTNFFKNLSPADAGTNEAKLWKRVSKSLDELSDDLF